MLINKKNEIKRNNENSKTVNNMRIKNNVME